MSSACERCAGTVERARRESSASVYPGAAGASPWWWSPSLTSIVSALDGSICRPPKSKRTECSPSLRVAASKASAAVRF